MKATTAMTATTATTATTAMTAMTAAAAMPPGGTISIVVPCRNEAGYIDAFLDSALGQALPDGVSLEVLVADGRSDDGNSYWATDIQQQPGAAWWQVDLEKT